MLFCKMYEVLFFQLLEAEKLHSAFNSLNEGNNYNLMKHCE